MLRRTLSWLALLLLSLNGLLFLWGWFRDTPLDPPLPPPPVAPLTLRLVHEPVPAQPYQVTAVAQSEGQAGTGEGTPVEVSASGRHPGRPQTRWPPRPTRRIFLSPHRFSVRGICAQARMNGCPRASSSGWTLDSCPTIWTRHPW